MPHRLVYQNRRGISNRKPVGVLQKAALEQPASVGRYESGPETAVFRESAAGCGNRQWALSIWKTVRPPSVS